jgi:hypothetical protein
MDDDNSIVVSMGKAEATVVGMALGLFLTKLNFDISSAELGVYDREMSALMDNFQMKVLSEQMFSSLWAALGMDPAEIGSMLEATERPIG